MLHRASFALLAMLVATTMLATGCAGTIDDGSGSDDGTSGPDAGVDLGPGDHEAVARAQLWVDAKVPYCQAANHQRDYDAACAMTCTRPDNPDWDAYRSDCSGLVSWAWGLPAPGRTTATLAPYDTTASQAIDATDLLPGDAINNDHHTMVFAEWITPGVKARFLEEPGCSAAQPYAREYIATVMPMGHTIVLLNRGTYTAIRRSK